VIVLIGFMGAGKSTVGRLLADELGLTFYDIDRVIEQRTQSSIAEIFEQFGEPHFRDLEQRTIEELLVGADAVIALGGGAVEQERVQVALVAAKRLGGTIIYLDVSYEQALARVGHDPKRPMLRRSDLAQLHASRARTYREVATVVVSSGARTTTEVVRDVLAVLPGQPTP
jgi:shikimate kinase